MNNNFAVYTAKLLMCFLAARLKRGEMSNVKKQNKTQHQVRCPICNGRLFDIVADENLIAQHCISYMVVIKCWKCHKEIKIIYSDLVQTPRICTI